MVERVANAIMGASFDVLTPGEAESYARAAIAAMREPTPEMVAVATCLALVGRAGYQPDELAAKIYQTMIGAALAEP